MRCEELSDDLAAAAEDLLTVRLSYGQVFSRPCWTSGRLAELYRARGWEGEAGTSGSGCSPS